jgi:protein-tyrosine phosphatase
MKSITFVCLGNICRSPIAEGCAIQLAKENSLDIDISSAGTSSWHVGEAPCENSIKVSKSHGIDISDLKASQFTQDDTDSYDLVIALDENNYSDLKNMGVKNLVKLGDFGYNSQDVPDPYFFNGFEGFDKVYDIIDKCVRELFEKHFLIN